MSARVANLRIPPTAQPREARERSERREARDAKQAKRSERREAPPYAIARTPPSLSTLNATSTRPAGAEMWKP